VGLKERVYAHTPPVLQSALLSAYGLLWRQRRLGGAFHRYVAEYAARDFLSAAEWQAYQGDRLAALLRHALQAVPAYRRLPMRADALHLLEGNRPFEALRLFPLLDKEALRRAPHDFVASQPGGRLGAALTSGTTGTPLRIMASADTHRRFMAAYEARVRRWAGVGYGDRRVMIGGRLIVPAQDRRGPFWRTNWAEHQLYMSAFHIGPDTALRYAAAIVRFAPRYLVGYASALWALADELERQGWRTPQPLAAVLTSSEPLRPDMRATLSRVWGCRVYDGYSGVESCCLAGECPAAGYGALRDGGHRAAQPRPAAHSLSHGRHGGTVGRAVRLRAQHAGHRGAGGAGGGRRDPARRHAGTSLSFPAAGAGGCAQRAGGAGVAGRIRAERGGRRGVE